MTALVKFEYKFFNNLEKLTLTLSRPEIKRPKIIVDLGETAVEAGGMFYYFNSTKV